VVEQLIAPSAQPVGQLSGARQLLERCARRDLAPQPIEVRDRTHSVKDSLTLA
jgi:hypothetical protein